MIFKLTYGPLTSDDSIWEFSDPLEIGDPTAAFFTGQSGSIDFNSANSADFIGLTTALSQGGPDVGSVATLIILGDPDIGNPGTGGWGNPNIGLALNGTQIDFIRLIVSSVVEYVDPTVPPEQGSNINVIFRSEYKWQFWGSPSPVPIPAALPLLASVLGALGFIGWRRKRKEKLAAA